MHEFGITSRIVEAVLRIAGENGATRVLEVDLQIGRLTFLNPQQVRFVYDILTKGTLLEGSELSVQEVEGLVECQDCGHQTEAYLPDDPNSFSDPLPLFSCSKCGGKVIVVKGKECQITGIALEN